MVRLHLRKLSPAEHEKYCNSSSHKKTKTEHNFHETILILSRTFSEKKSLYSIGDTSVETL